MISTTKTSLKRWLRQVCFVPIFYNRWLTKEVKARLSEQVTEAEKGHRGEVFLIIENHLPIADAYHYDSRDRAIDLFSQYRVWDTEENTGVLVYVNICEHSLEIVADRGINNQVADAVWQGMCDDAILGIKAGSAEQSLQQLLMKIGEQLRAFYQLEGDPEGNELQDTLVYLK